jgi:hypothetical protein
MRFNIIKISLTILSLFVIDLVLLGPYGVEIFGINTRKFLFLTLIFFSIFLIKREESKNKIIKLIAILVLILYIMIWGILVPVLKQENLDLALLELRSYLWIILLIIIGTYIKLDNENIVRKSFIFSMRVFSILILFLWIAAEKYERPEFAFAFRLFMSNLNGENNINDNLFIGPIDDGSFRVMWISSFLLPVATYVTYLVKNNYNKLIDYILFSAATYASGTRAFILIQILLLIIIIIKSKSSLIQKFLISFGSLISAVILIKELISSERRIIDFASELDVENPRFSQALSLFELFNKAIFLGNGFGAHAEMVRNEAAPYSYELVFLSLLTKIGLVGFIPLISYLSYIFIMHLNKENNLKIFMIISLLFITSTNPYLATPYFMLAIALVIYIDKYKT